MIKRELSIDIAIFPPSVRKYLENSKLFDSSCSKLSVYYSDAGCYVKVAEKGKLAHEAELSKMFYSLGIGAQVLEFHSTDKDYLVTREAIGTDLTHCTDRPEMICRILADSLRSLHGMHYVNAPASPALTEYLKIAHGEFTESDFKTTALTERFGICGRSEAWQIVRENNHLLYADTLIHGDACLPNVIQKDGKFSSFIDFAMSGKGDKHIDLYWALWSLWYNLKTDKYTDLFLDLYGRDNFDIELIRTVAALEIIG